MSVYPPLNIEHDNHSVLVLISPQTLTQELYKRQSALEVISDKLQPILAVLNFDETPSLDELVQQVETNGKSLEQIETNLLDLNIGLSQDNIATNSDAELPRSRTISEGMRKHFEAHSRSVSSGHIKQKSEIEPPVLNTNGQQREGNYAEIGSLREDILNRQFAVGSSNVPGPSLRGVQRSSEIEGQRSSSLYERLELPSPLAEFDHVSNVRTCKRQLINILYCNILKLYL